jgi:arylsulfatase A-like enzyme
VADNPLLDGERFADVRRKPGGSAPTNTQAQRWVAPVVPGGVSGDERWITQVVDDGVSALRRLKGSQPFFLAVDAFDPAEATEPTPVYLGPSDALVQRERSEDRERETPDKVRFGRAEAVDPDVSGGELRDHYAGEVAAVDREIGRLLDELDRQALKDRTLVYLVSAGTTALGEHGVYGNGAAAGHEEVYKVAYMIRDPDGRRAGEHENFYASTHDVAPTVLSHLGLTIPGKMDGEDLTAFFDDDDPPPRRHFSSCVGDNVIIGDQRYVLVADFEGAEKRLYDTDPPKHEDERGDDKDFSPRDEDEDVSREEAERVRMMWDRVVQDAGGTIPKFGPDGPIRPRQEADENDDDEVDEGILDRDDDLNFSGQ